MSGQREICLMPRKDALLLDVVPVTATIISLMPHTASLTNHPKFLLHLPRPSYVLILIEQNQKTHLKLQHVLNPPLGSSSSYFIACIAATAGAFVGSTSSGLFVMNNGTFSNSYKFHVTCKTLTSFE